MDPCGATQPLCANAVEKALSEDQKSKVIQILNQVCCLSDVEKLLLYLKLPIGGGDSRVTQSSSSRSAVTLAWIQSHYIEDKSENVQKQDVFDHYRSYCDSSGIISVSSADFGKMVKVAFPNIHHRRLGQRGKSKYCYVGLRKRKTTEPVRPASNGAAPVSSEIPLSNSPSEVSDLHRVSCELVCEWASLVLERAIPNISSLCQHLVDVGLSCGRAASKFFLLSDNLGLQDKTTRQQSHSRHQDRQMLLQRKLLQNELIRQHRHKVKQQPQREMDSTMLGEMMDGRLPLWAHNKLTVSSSPILSSPLTAAHGVSAQPLTRTSVELINDKSLSNRSVQANILIMPKTSDVVCEQSSHHSSSGVQVCVSPRNRLPSTRPSSTVVKNPLGLFSKSVVEYDLSKNAQETTQHPVNCSIAVTQDSGSLNTVYSPCRATGEGEHVSEMISKMLELPTHKRIGTSISPERASTNKRRCITSLGVRQQALEENWTAGQTSHLPSLVRSRSYSCPTVCTDPQRKEIGRGNVFAGSNENVLNREGSQCWNGVHEGQNPGLSVEWGKTAPQLHNSLSRTASCEPQANLDRSAQPGTGKEQPCAGTDDSNSHDYTFHCVQKPVVISCLQNKVHPGSSCPNLHVSSHLSEHWKPKPGQVSYNILNSLLSADQDSLPMPEMLSERARCLSSSSTDVHQRGLRLIYSLPQGADSSSLLSSRSAFVPVTSHKLQGLDTQNKPTVSSDNVIIGSESGTELDGDLKIRVDHHRIYDPTADTKKEDSSEVTAGIICEKDMDSYITCQKSEASVVDGDACNSICSHGLSATGRATKAFDTHTTATGHSDQPTLANHICESLTSQESKNLDKKIVNGKSGPDGLSTTTAPIVSQTGSAPTPILQVANSSARCKSSSSNRQPNIRCGASSTTPTKHSAKSRFTPIRPKLGGGSSTPSPQKKDMQPVSAILKEKRVRTAQELLVNLASTYQREVKVQMPAEFLGLSPPRKAKGSEVVVTIGPANSTGLNGDGPAVANGSSGASVPAGMHTELTVRTHADIDAATPRAAHLVSPGLASINTSMLGPLAGMGMPANSLSQPVTSSVRQEGIADRRTPFNTANFASLVLSPTKSQMQSVSPGPSSIIVEDGQGNKYVLDQMSHQQNNSQDGKIDFPSGKEQAVVNVSEIKGHVIGPDAYGQSYLLVPNSESWHARYTSDDGTMQLPSTAPMVTATSVSSSVHRTSSVTLSSTTTTTVTSALVPVGPRPKSLDIITATSQSYSSALLSGLSQLITAESDAGGQDAKESGVLSLTPSGLVQMAPKEQALSELKWPASPSHGETSLSHHATLSAFHRCPVSSSTLNSSTSELISSSTEKDSPPQTSQMILSGSHGIEKVCGENPSHQLGMESVPQHGHQSLGECVVNESAMSGRKRKASQSQMDKHEDNKRFSSSHGNKNESRSASHRLSTEKSNTTALTETIEVREKGDGLVQKHGGKDISKSSLSNRTSELEEDDVFVVNIEDKLCHQPLASLVNGTQKAKPRSVQKHSTSLMPGQDIGRVGQVRDAATLIGLIEKSKSITVKQAVQAINSLRAQISNEKRTVSQGSEILNGAMAKKAAEFSANYSQPTEKSCPSYIRSTRRNVSLNVESLESDALLDTEPALDHQLVSDMSDSSCKMSDHKTSVGVAARSVRASTSVQRKERKSKYGQEKPPYNISTSALISCHKIISDREKLDRHCKEDNPSTNQSLHGLHSRAQQGQKLSLQKTCSGIKGQTAQTLYGDVDKSLLEDVSCTSIDGSKSVRSPNLSHQDPPNQKSNLQSCVFGEELSSLKRTQEPGNKTDTSHISLTMTTDLYPCRSQTSQDSKNSGVDNVDELRIDDCLGSAVTTAPDQQETIMSKETIHCVTTSHTRDSEIPVDIVDFITESMSSRPACLRPDIRQSLGFLMSQNCTNLKLLRSLSVPNTVPDLELVSHASPARPHLSSPLAPCDNGSAVDSLRCHSVLGLAPVVTHLPEQQLSGPSLSTDEESSRSASLEQKKDPDPVSGSEGVSTGSGTFLSPIAPAKLTRRSSIERAVERHVLKFQSDQDSMQRQRKETDKRPSTRAWSKDNSHKRMPVDRAQTKTSLEKSQSKLYMTKTRSNVAIDRPLMMESLDRSHVNTLVDRTMTPVNRAMIDSPLATVSLDKTPTTEVTASIQSMPRDNIIFDKSVSDIFSNISADTVDRSFSQTPVDGLLYQGYMSKSALDSSRVSRSLTETPVSDAGYCSVSATPISEVGCSSISPSPIMMAGWGEFRGRDTTSPATIFMPLRLDSTTSGVASSENASVSDRPTDLQHYPTSAERNPDQNVNQEPEHLWEEEKHCSENESNKFLTEAIQDIPPSIVDLEKLLSISLQCIPTPPSSPSSSPDNPTHSPLPLPIHTTSIQPLKIKETTVVPTFTTPQSPITASSPLSSISFSRRRPISFSPKSTVEQPSPRTTPIFSPSPHSFRQQPSPSPQSFRQQSSPHPCYSHPSPPFTPSLTSPRCPTPCSLASSRCPTPFLEPGLTPDRFMPIQSSNIVPTAVGIRDSYIQPIRPVVTLASAAPQDDNKTLAQDHNIAQTNPFCMKVDLEPKSVNTCISNSISPAPTQLSSFIPCLETNKKKKSWDILSNSNGTLISSGQSISHTCTISQQKASVSDSSKQKSSGMVLSLSGSIGCVSGSGVQTVWGKGHTSSSEPSGSTKDISMPNRPSAEMKLEEASIRKQAPSLDLASALDRVRNEANIPADILPSYKEAVLLLTSQELQTSPLPETEDQEPRTGEKQPSTKLGLSNAQSSTSKLEAGIKGKGPQSSQLPMSNVQQHAPTFPFSLQLVMMSGRSSMDNSQPSLVSQELQKNVTSKATLQKTYFPENNSCPSLKAILQAPPFSVSSAVSETRSQQPVVSVVRNIVNSNSDLYTSSHASSDSKRNRKSQDMKDTESKDFITSLSSVSPQESSSHWLTQGASNNFPSAEQVTEKTFSSPGSMPAHDWPSLRPGNTAGSILPSTPPVASNRNIQSVSSILPAANYAGTAPNVALTKTSLSVPMTSHQMLSSAKMTISSNMHEDDLQATLDVLKNMDSHYFQSNDDDTSNSSL